MRSWGSRSSSTIAPAPAVSLGAEIVAKSPADGYTLLFGNISLAFNQAFYASLPYDAVADFAPVTLASVQPNIVVIHPGVPAHTVMEFAALARAKPGQLTFASAGIGSGTHLAGELLAQSLKIKLLHVPYRGTGPALDRLVGGQVQMMVSTFALGAAACQKRPPARARRHQRETLARDARCADADAKPASPGYDYSTWYGLLAPARTSRTIVDILHRKTLAALARDDMKLKLEAQGVETVTNTPAEFLAYLKSETDKWAKVVRAAGIQPQ